MKSLYKRQLAMMLGIVILSFTLLSTAFMLLSYYYILSEKREGMEGNARYIATFTAMYERNGTRNDEYYRNFVAYISMVSDSTVLISDENGSVFFATDGTYFYDYEGVRVPDTILDSIRDGGVFTGMTSLNGIFPEMRYLTALPITLDINGASLLQGVVLVSVDTSSVSEMWQATATIFFFAAVVVLLIAVVASTLTSAYQTKPLNEMAEAARKFGRGEFDVRLVGYENREDEIGELAEAFNTMASSLSKAEETRSDFIANVSHELKTPMTTIAGFAEGILDGTIPAEREKEFLQVIVSETRRLSRLVRKMLDLSRLNAMAETVTAQEQFDLTEIVSQVIISLEGKINERTLDVEAIMPEDPVMVWGDPDSITQVCYNLLDNAAKFAAAGSKLTLRITQKDDKVLTSISNLGATIPADELPLLFDRFHKADYSRSIDRDGVGLGLYIVKTILSNLKETITVTSEDGETCFTFSLTLA